MTYKHIHVGNTDIYAKDQVIACIPYGSPGYVQEPGFQLTKCGCGDRMWIGPKSRKMRAEGMEAMCIPCALVIQNVVDPGLGDTVIANISTQRTRFVHDAIAEALWEGNS